MIIERKKNRKICSCSIHFSLHSNMNIFPARNLSVGQLHSYNSIKHLVFCNLCAIIIKLMHTRYTYRQQHKIYRKPFQLFKLFGKTETEHRTIFNFVWEKKIVFFSVFSENYYVTIFLVPLFVMYSWFYLVAICLLLNRHEI